MDIKLPFGLKLKQQPSRRDLIKLGIILPLYIVFLIWAQSWLGIIVIPFIIDAYVTKYIRWTWWKDHENPVVRTVMSWVDAIVFALVAVYFVNIYFFQNYTIPSSSLEKSLLVGDYLFVSKMSYGPRIPQTPLHMPLTQHTLPTGNKSYLEWIQWDYKRIHPHPVQLNDIVVFNYPSGDTVVANPKYQAQDFYQIAYGLGQQHVASQNGGKLPSMEGLTTMQQREMFAQYYIIGRAVIDQNPQTFGGIIARPVDRRENYVKRCVGLPGQTFEIRDRVIYNDGKANKEPDNAQFNYRVYLKQNVYQFPKELAEKLGISNEDLDRFTRDGILPLTNAMLGQLTKETNVVDSVVYDNDDSTLELYPLNANTGWTRDNYGPLWIPAKGKSIELTLENLPIYERAISVYEGNKLEVRPDGTILINGKPSTSYQFRMDYYWMMGDNRHNSADSRYWGFVPEDHIVGKPIMIWLSTDKDKGWFNGHIRWNRMFRLVDNIK